MEQYGADMLFKETGWTTFNDEKRIAKVKVLCGMMRSHTVREQGPIFDGARRIIAAGDAHSPSDTFREGEAA